MAFKSVAQYNEEKYGGLFRLPNDNDFADVVFLYRSHDDVLIADTHYIKSDEYSGYVHCNGKACPACAKGIRTQTKLFVPMYNITDKEVQFFDRSIRFQNQLEQDVFSKYPNPVDFVFRITRHGEAGSMDTTYSIVAVGKNTEFPYDKILADNNIKMPDHYETICRDVNPGTLSQWLNNPNKSEGYQSNEDMPDYTVTPRAPSVKFGASPEASSLDVVEDLDSESNDSTEEIEGNPEF